jgi:hypothetical protein
MLADGYGPSAAPLLAATTPPELLGVTCVGLDDRTPSLGGGGAEGGSAAFMSDLD